MFLCFFCPLPYSFSVLLAISNDEAGLCLLFGMFAQPGQRPPRPTCVSLFQCIQCISNFYFQCLCFFCISMFQFFCILMLPRFLYFYLASLITPYLNLWRQSVLCQSWGVPLLSDQNHTFYHESSRPKSRRTAVAQFS